MAGIGFELRRILAEDTFTSMVKGYLYSTVISSGPWLMSVLSLAGLGVFSVSFLGFQERQTFASTVVYIYAASLVGTGFWQMLVTRYLSDRLYQGEREVISEAFIPVVLVTMLTQGPIAIAALWSAPLPTAYKVSAAVGFFMVSLVWQVMIFLSASRDYGAIVISFLTGALISIVAGLLWGRSHGLLGYLNGFNLGQFAILALLSIKILREFGISSRQDWGFLRYIKAFPQLVGIGFAYNLSVWIDKFMFGTLSPYGRITAERFATYNQYDSSMFLAFFAMAPSMAIFLARTETDFAEVYKVYYDNIFFRRPYNTIMKSKKAMTDVLLNSFLDLVKIQGLITFIFIYFADDILRAVHLPYSQTSMFRYGLLGAFMQVLMLFVHIILLYFDLRGTVLALSFFFLFANLVGTFISLDLGFSYYGSGFAAATFLGLATSVIFLYRRLGDMEYITFAKRKIVGQVTGTSKDLARPGGGYGRYLPCPGGEGELKSTPKKKD
ncbi:MAG: exopolysaccharide Pel transporter PelG [Deltaproteobacteria bacterium]|nr:exopolysaccharide Pel transporter PelG [Deltaproteobacteria bacterium]